MPKRVLISTRVIRTANH